MFSFRLAIIVPSVVVAIAGCMAARQEEYAARLGTTDDAKVTGGTPSGIQVHDADTAFDGGTSIADVTLDASASYPICEIGNDADGGADGGDDAGVNAPLGEGDLTVLLVFDKSTSMDLVWDHRSRWQAASDAMVGAMQPYADNLTIGAILFPQLDLCMVAPLEHEVQFDYQPGRTFLRAWLERVCHPHDAWGTPLQLALAEADRAVERAHDLGLLEDRFRVLLVTDGEPTCDDDSDVIVGYAERWSTLGVETYVIGLPGSEAAANLLDQIAAAGGTGAHQSPGTPEELGTQLQAVVQ